jgi:hypothetical protein
VGGVDSDGQEVFQNADLDIGTIDCSLDIAPRLTFTEMVLTHGEVEVCCLVIISLKLLVRLDGGCCPCWES